uniref:Sarcosine dehydrogenase n=1 Tax=Equus asinus asinus TaxID=83772 RepID=A0A8C4LNW4_EQUAS
MASLSRALCVAATRPRWSPACSLGLRPLTSGAVPTTEKSVPYQRTLKQAQVAQGPTRPLPSTANVVVIGGGSLGCQTLYHLAKLGVSGAVLLERERLTSGTTWHTAGLLWQLRPSDVEVELLAHTRRVVSRDLEEETGLHTGWIQNGGLFIASNRQRLDEYKRLMSLGKAYGVESHVLSPAETKALYPLMNVDDLYGTLYVPQDGTMDPAGTCTTLARAATARGAQVIENCPVTGIRVRTDDFGVRRVAAVETEHGSIQTPCVVNCAGVWAGAVGRMAGVKVPLVAMHHAYVVTERIEGIQNMPNVRDHDASVYLRLQGDALSVGGYEANPIFWEEVSDKFAFGLFDLDWDVFTQHIEGAINRVPVLEKTGVKSTVCGPESFTPDHKPLMGEAPELRGFFLGCGFNSAGMMLGGGCGQELAHWIVHGRPEKDMYGYDIRRFHHSLTDHRRWIRERSHEFLVRALPPSRCVRPWRRESSPL